MPTSRLVWVPLTWLALGLLLLLRATWRVRRVPQDLRARVGQGPVVIALRHGELLPLLACHRGLRAQVLVSWSPDGELLAGVLTRWGMRVARGSSSRGGAEGLAQLERGLAEGWSAVLAVDGPRGPAGVPKPGALRLAQATGAPVLALRARSRPVLRLRTWDAMELPLPFARVEIALTPLEPGLSQGVYPTQDALAAALGP